MTAQPIVEFAAETRIHMGIGVRDLEQSIAFYSRLLDQAPTKVRSGYARFEVAEPPVNLTLNEGRPDGVKSSTASHFGIQVKSTDAVRRVADRLRKVGLRLRVETDVTCCYAVQDKVWTTDPDGNEEVHFPACKHPDGRPYLVLLRVGFTVPRCVATRAVRSYRTFSPLPAPDGAWAV